MLPDHPDVAIDRADIGSQSMNPDQDNDRISQITTMWTEIFQAHRDRDESQRVLEAQQHVFNRYGRCIYQYLLGATRDSDVAEELGQEFALRFVRGDFRNVSPQRGRFRDYLRVSLGNLVNDYFRRQKTQRSQPFDDSEFAGENPIEILDEQFETAWRNELISAAWKQLKQDEQAGSHTHYQLLRFRVDHPDQSSRQLAGNYSSRIGKRVDSAWIRQNIRRAREKFAGFLYNEVKQTVPDTSPDLIEQELADLRLLKYCRVDQIRD